MTALAASSAAMNAVAASSAAKMVLFNSDVALNAVAASATAMASLRAAAQYSVVSWAQNGTTPVAFALSGTSHIVLGISQAATQTGRTNTFTTLRNGTAISGTTPSYLNVSSTTALDCNVAIPIVAPRTAAVSATSTNTGYIGILRCDA